jgi:aminotransferase
MPTTSTPLQLSDISPAIIQSEIRSMTVECAAINGINMAQGVCDTDPPAPVVEAALAAIRDGFNTYTRLDGISTLRTAIAQKLAHYNGITANPDTQVLVTSGATGALYAACLALLNPGDEVIIFEPCYGYHASTLLSLRIKPVFVPMQAPDWQLDLRAVEAALTSRTRAIILNSPGNPSGKVFFRKELESLADIAIGANLFVFTDEIYEYFLYDGTQHISPATLPGMAERTITISGFSKTFSVTGWRLGYLTASERWIPSIGYFHDLTYVCAPSPLQHGAAAGLLALPDHFYTEMSQDYEQKRNTLCTALAEAGLTPSVPQGAYYVLADSSRIPGATAKIKARQLLKDTGIAAVAGTAFFGSGNGENLLRFCFAKKDADLQEACRRLRNT